MSNHEAQDLHDRPIGETAGALLRDVSLLVRQELQLAKAELREKGALAVPAVAMFGAAAVVGLATVGALTAFVILVLTLFLAPWLAALIAGVVLAVVAAGLAMAGRQRLERMGQPVPEQTIRTVQEDVQWVKEQARSGRT